MDKKLYPYNEINDSKWFVINIPLGKCGRKPVEETNSQDLFFRKYVKIDECKKGNKLTACIDANIM
jgi:hypothetical protein